MNPNDRITTDSGKPCIRGIPLYDIYRKMMWDDLTDDAILQNYSDLKPEDLPAVREYIANSIRSRTTDEFTGRPILPIYNWREKFGRIYIETIKYPTDETDWFLDVFDVVQELPNPKFEIPFDENAEFQGNRDDLYEYTEEMWHRPKE